LEEFPDALELMPNLTEDFLKNPTGPLGTIKCFPWQYKGKNMI
jgi:kynurenine 3-monooxygenase